MTNTAPGAPADPQPAGDDKLQRFSAHLSELREHLAAAERTAQQLGNSEFAVFGRFPTWMAIEQMRGGMLQALRGWNLANYFREEYAHELDREVADGKKSHRDNSGRADVPNAQKRRHGLLDKLTRRGRRES